MKALYDYTASQSDELTFKAGETITVVRVINPEWTEGNIGGRKGIFPSAFAKAISGPPPAKGKSGSSSSKRAPPPRNAPPSRAPPPKSAPPQIKKSGSGRSDINRGEGEAVATAEFVAQEKSDLGFKTGAVIVLTKRINDEWFEGRIGAKKGIFPANFVNVTRALGSSSSSSSSSNGRGGNSSAVVGTKGGGAPGGGASSSKNDLSGKLARALFDYEKGHKDDLAFKKGATIRLIKRIDAQWFKGELNGDSGIFPSDFVEILQESSGDRSKITATSAAKRSTPRETKQVAAAVAATDDPWGDYTTPPAPKSSGSSSGGGSSSSRGVDGGGTAGGYSKPPPLLSKSKPKNSGGGVSDGITPMAKALFDYQGQPGDLSFGVGDSIILTKRIDAQWLQGYLLGSSQASKGIFPTSFVEIITDLP
eukprot:UC1_evm1s738